MKTIWNATRECLESEPTRYLSGKILAHLSNRCRIYVRLWSSPSFCRIRFVLWKLTMIWALLIVREQTDEAGHQIIDPTPHLFARWVSCDANLSPPPRRITKTRFLKLALRSFPIDHQSINKFSFGPSLLDPRRLQLSHSEQILVWTNIYNLVFIFLLSSPYIFII